MLDHPDPAIVGGLLIRQLAVGVRRELVDVGKFDLLEFVLVVVDDRPHIRGGRTPRRRRDELAVACQLKVGVGGDWRRAAVGDLERGIDDIAAAVEGQRLHDFRARRRGRLELQCDGLSPGGKLARSG